MRRRWSAISLAAAISCAAWGQPGAPGPRFEITDAHPSANTSNPYTFMSGGVLRGERFDLRKATMLDMIRIAYGVDPEKVVGGPSWLEFDRFDVAGKAPAGTPPETVKLMIQALLADRFNLAVHRDTRPLPAFALTAGSKPKLREAIGSGETGCDFQSQSGSGPFRVFVCHNMTMAAFAQALRGMAGDYLPYPVTDSTHLKGSWDFELKWNQRSQILPPGAARATIFTAIEQQLGLKLELGKAPEAVLVVDRVNEKPTDNALGAAQMLPPPVLQFEVADIRPSRSDEQSMYKLYPNGRFEWRAMPMKILIATGWDVDWDHIDEVMSGAPNWLDSKRFDILAKTAAAPDEPSGSGFIDDDVRTMIRNMLLDRFKMKTHLENRPVPAYTLSAVKPKLKKADPANRTRCRQARVVANDPRDLNPRLANLIECRNISMAQFAKQLQSMEPATIPNEVEDATGISGAWDFTLSYTPTYMLQTSAPGQPAGTASDPGGGISLADAISKQLGLKLEMRRRTMPVLVIDHMEETPTEN